jgi:hypothetical protein
MSKFILAALAAATFAATVPAHADSLLDPQDFSVTPRVSTLGFGADAGFKLNDQFGLRLNGNAFSISRDGEASGVDYDVDVDLRTVGLLADWHPFSGGFRISAGAYYNGNKASLTGQSNETVKIGNTTYDLSQAGSLKGDVEFSKVAPYLGVGYYGNLGGGFSIGAELGAMYTGSPKISLSSDSTIISAADIEEERRQAEDDIKAFKFYPVLSVGIKYKF